MNLNLNGALYFYINIPAKNSLVTLHTESCSIVSEPLKRKYVGLFPSKSYAFEKLSKQYPELKICKKCLGEDY